LEPLPSLGSNINKAFSSKINNIKI
jgi:hypothetical protein